MHEKKRGFTLIELLVVIAIIALLMSILMPALSKVKKQAMAVVCRSRYKQWGVIFSMYTGQNDGFFHARQVGNDIGYSRMWPYVYKKMYNDPLMRFCPAAVNPANNKGPNGTWNYTNGGSYRPRPPPSPLAMPGEREYDADTGVVEDGWFTGSIGMNRYVENMQGGNFGTDAGFFRRADVKGGDKVPVMMDCQYLYWWTSGTSEDDPPAYNGDIPPPDWHLVSMDRHMGSTNVCYMDFSARKTGIKELWTLKQTMTFDTCNMWTICGNGSRTSCKTRWDDKSDWMKSMPVY